jgi:hypothetical protein
LRLARIERVETKVSVIIIIENTKFIMEGGRYMGDLTRGRRITPIVKWTFSKFFYFFPLTIALGSLDCKSGIAT